jgi:hemoglobin
MKKIALIVSLSVVAGFTAAQAANTEKSLYDRLGGKPAIQAVANGLVDQILVDNRVNKWFTHAAASVENTKGYKTNLAEFLCVSAGGPCTYNGPDMMAAHKGRGVTGEAFAAVAQDLALVLDHLQVPEKEKNQVMQLVASLKPTIVQASATQK